MDIFSSAPKRRRFAPGLLLVALLEQNDHYRVFMFKMPASLNPWTEWAYPGSL
jgi:hypothetical protein